MSWLVEKRGNKYGLWTTISDGWLTDPPFLSRAEMLKMIKKLKQERLNDEMKELRKTFPYPYFDRKTNRRFTPHA